MSLINDLARTTDQMFSRAELKGLLESGRPLRIKYGVDCTAPFLHIGHAVNLWMMRRMQDAGHHVIFLLGDATTAVGDPTGRNATRPVLTADEIEANAAAFVEQVALVLRTDPAVFSIRRNSQWYGEMAVPQWLQLMSQVTHAQLLGRDMFRQRIAEGRDIAMHELCYPILQGYDSVVLDADLVIVGSDQLFNEMLGRQLQQRAGKRPQVVITTTITAGIDGTAKQSKSLNNFVALTDPPREKFGKLMSIPDHLVADYLKAYTTVPMSVVAQAKRAAADGGVAVRDAKLGLARAVVARYHGDEIAAQEKDWFIATFAQREVPADVPDVPVPATMSVYEMVRIARPTLGAREARRLIAGDAVRLDGLVLNDPAQSVTVEGSAVLKVGRRQWVRLVARD
jgi:tyrosyl-tRNA synthetase